MKRLFIALIVLTLSVAPSFALSDAEYLYMKKTDPEYARADQRLTRIWNELKQSMSASAFNELKKEQLAWIRGGRDEDAEIYLERDYSRVEAYTMATEARSEYLQNIQLRGDF